MYYSIQPFINHAKLLCTCIATMKLVVFMIFPFVICGFYNKTILMFALKKIILFK